MESDGRPVCSTLDNAVSSYFHVLVLRVSTAPGVVSSEVTQNANVRLKVNARLKTVPYVEVMDGITAVNAYCWLELAR